MSGEYGACTLLSLLTSRSYIHRVRLSYAYSDPASPSYSNRYPTWYVQLVLYVSSDTELSLGQPQNVLYSYLHTNFVSRLNRRRSYLTMF
jgi:hypothetical protein